MLCRMTQVEELTSIGQGLAAGCLAIGVRAVTSTKMTVEFAFIHAWRDWAYSSRFPKVRADQTRNDIYYQIIGRSERRNGGHLAAWDVGRWLEPYFHGQWTVDDAADLMPTYTGVPWDGWLELAKLFVAGFSDDELIRA
jgi:hypothetical protein